MTVFEMVRHAIAHLPAGWVVTGATNTKLHLRYAGAEPMGATAIDIPGMGFRLKADGTAVAILCDGRKVVR